MGIKDVNTDQLLVTQVVDTNGDGVFDVLLFQPKIAPNSEKPLK
ncbi:hypothetical protein [Kordia sp.]